VKHKDARTLRSAGFRREQKKETDAPRCNARPSHMEKAATQNATIEDKFTNGVIRPYGSMLPACNLTTILRAYPASPVGI
jgi:hypothetical protein